MEAVARAEEAERQVQELQATGDALRAEVQQKDLTLAQQVQTPLCLQQINCQGTYCDAVDVLPDVRIQTKRDLNPGETTISGVKLGCGEGGVHMGCHHDAAQVEDLHKKAESLEQRDADIRALTEAAAVAASEHETLQADIVVRKAEIETLEAQVCLSIPRLDRLGIRLAAWMHHHPCDASFS